MTDNASPRPWSYIHSQPGRPIWKDEIIDADGEVVADTIGEADGLLIVAAVNAYDPTREKSVWPDFAAPPQYDDPAEDWEDPKLPDFRLIWDTARKHGYAVGLHGSMRRDCDLIAVPWVDNYDAPAALIESLCLALNARQIGETEKKPFDRIAVTLQIDGWFKSIDLSIAQPSVFSEDKREAAFEAMLAPADECTERVEDKGDTALEAALKDPVAVHANMLHGKIATPTVSQLRHIRPEIDKAYRALEAAQKALQFYGSRGDGWRSYCGDHGVPIGIEPSDRMKGDEGSRADDALTLIQEARNAE